MVPLFVLGFLLAAALRTVGDLADGRSGCSRRMGAVPEGGRRAAAWCLTLAMASVGLGTGLSRIRRLGWKAFAVGLAAALVVGRRRRRALITALGAVFLLAAERRQMRSQGRKPLERPHENQLSPGGATERTAWPAFCRPSGARVSLASPTRGLRPGYASDAAPRLKTARLQPTLNTPTASASPRAATAPARRSSASAPACCGRRSRTAPAGSPVRSPFPVRRHSDSAFGPGPWRGCTVRRLGCGG